MTASSGDTLCEYAADCDENQQCIDTRCMCNPMFAHTGLYCDELRPNSWALGAVLVLVSLASVTLLASAAKKVSKTPSRCGSGLAQLVTMLLWQKGEDMGATTIRVVVASAVIDISSYLWMTMTAIGAISDSTFTYWQARLFFPVGGGLTVLPTAIVISVWVDLSKSCLSRLKWKKKVKRTKTLITLGATFYTVVLFLLGTFERAEYGRVLQFGAIGVSLNACGSGAAQLCARLRTLGGSSARIAEEVFKVSRSMGICLYAMICSEVLIISSQTRKSDPANLAIVGVAGCTLAKCFLNKAIIDYMVVSSRAKGAAKQVVSSGAKGSRYEGAPRSRALVPSMPVLIPVSKRRAWKPSVAIDDTEDNPPEKPVSAGEDEVKHDGLDRGEWPTAERTPSSKNVLDVAETDDSEDKAAETDSSEDEINETVDSSEGETVPYQAPVVKRNKHRAGKYEGSSDAGHDS
ncbi:unnamed protein product [Ectocarpus sp. 6 AP-2014]